MTTNEAAERLRIPDGILRMLRDAIVGEGESVTIKRLDGKWIVDGNALAAERRATVARIREAINDHAARHGWRNVTSVVLFRILAEAAR